MLFRPRTDEDARVNAETRDGKRATRRTSPNGGNGKRSLLFLSDSLASVFLNLSSASDLVTARATDALAHLGSGSDGAFDAVARALARALFEDEARAFRARKEASKASRAGAQPRREIVRDASTRRATRAEDGERLQGVGDDIYERERERAEGSQSSQARAVGERELEDATGDKRRSPGKRSARVGKFREETRENSGAGGERRDARGRVRRRRGARGRVVLSA